jgi:hypothetical protein
MAQYITKFDKKVCIDTQKPTVLAVMSMHMGRSLLFQFGFSLMKAWVNIWAKIQTKHLGLACGLRSKPNTLGELTPTLVPW